MSRGPKSSAAREELLRRAWERGRQRWPQVDLPVDAFERALASVFSEASVEEPLAAALERMDVEGLYLALACVRRLPRAVELLERHYMAKLPGQLRYLRLPETVVDDVCQRVREHLLVGTAQAGPKLAGYTGRGSLMTWIRVTAARMVGKLGSSAPEVPEEQVLEALPTPEPDAELELARRQYHHAFRAAFREALNALPHEQRYLLRLHFMERLTTTQMAPLFGKDQSTISRWLKGARRKVHSETKRRLQERLKLSSRQFESHTQALQGHFDVSISQLLRESEGN